MALSCDTRELLTCKKTAAGWLDGGTPPTIVTLNEKRRSVISNSLVSAIKANIGNYNFTYTSGLVPFPPLPGTTLNIPPIIITEANSSGKYFVSRGKHQQPQSDSRSIDSVSINGKPYQGPIFDPNDQKINLLIDQMLRVIMVVIVWPIIMILISFNNTFTNPITFLFSSMRPGIAATGSSINSG